MGQWVTTAEEDGIATVTLDHGKVNALVPEVVEQLGAAVRAAAESETRAVILTGSGPFFSFGFDVPHMIDWERRRFGDFLKGFTTLYRELFMVPCPLVAAINGHAVAGGAMIALAADERVIAGHRAKLSLNEVTFGASVFAGFVEMLRFHVDGRIASRILGLGEMLSADEAFQLGLVDEVVEPNYVIKAARERAVALSRNPHAFAAIKRLLRRDVAERMQALEPDSIEAFLDVWYSDATRPQLADIKIR